MDSAESEASVLASTSASSHVSDLSFTCVLGSGAANKFHLTALFWSFLPAGERAALLQAGFTFAEDIRGDLQGWADSLQSFPAVGFTSVLGSGAADNFRVTALCWAFLTRAERATILQAGFTFAEAIRGDLQGFLLQSDAPFFLPSVFAR